MLIFLGCLLLFENFDTLLRSHPITSSSRWLEGWKHSMLFTVLNPPEWGRIYWSKWWLYLLIELLYFSEFSKGYESHMNLDNGLCFNKSIANISHQRNGVIIQESRKKTSLEIQAKCALFFFETSIIFSFLSSSLI